MVEITTILGIDEAGRGPVIGPMVMAGVVIKGGTQEKLSSIGVKDSKLLTPKKREELYPKVLEIVESYKIVVLEPEIIDNALENETLNLNWLEANTSADIINELNPDKSIIDCPSTNISAYKEYISRLIKNNEMELSLEHNAERFMPVAAASLLAKVTRDRIIEKLKKEIGKDFGSGYMSDEKTQKFLEEYHDKYANIFRKTWSSYKKVFEKKFQKNLGEF